MPRVNRDLQRRMAARRERERRRPSGERRYQFTTPETALEADEPLAEEQEEATEAVETVADRRRATRERAQTQGQNRVGTRTVKPFSAYREEYAYVYGDLRRVGLVIGSLLAVLIVLYFVLPALVH